MAIRQSSLSTEYVRYQVEALFNGLPHDPTADVVKFAFLPIGIRPSSGDWVAGVWQVTTLYGANAYYACCLVGPGGKVLAQGNWVVWIQIADNPESLVRVVGDLQIT